MYQSISRRKRRFSQQCPLPASMIDVRRKKCLSGILDLVYLPTSVMEDYFVKRHTAAAKVAGSNLSFAPMMIVLATIAKQIVGDVVNTDAFMGAQV
mmetsp:Transcript_30320/g.39130  ORF Transcript_30320/g.39130 Transcript_30320/m.39130 type:complete len:96 (-) Transcript_30320:1404-1691(-)